MNLSSFCASNSNSQLNPNSNLVVERRMQEERRTSHINRLVPCVCLFVCLSACRLTFTLPQLDLIFVVCVCVDSRKATVATTTASLPAKTSGLSIVMSVFLPVHLFVCKFRNLVDEQRRALWCTLHLSSLNKRYKAAQQVAIVIMRSSSSTEAAVAAVAKSPVVQAKLSQQGDDLLLCSHSH